MEYYLGELETCLSHEDTHENGYTGGMYDHTFDLRFDGRSKKEIEKKIKGFFGTDELKRCDDGRYIVSRYEDEDGQEASEQDMEAWRQGEKRLWDVTYYFGIFKIIKERV